MGLDVVTRNEIIAIIARLGSDGALITEIAPHASCERHTLAKYLGIMEHEGSVYHKAIGKGKLWFIQVAPLKTAVTPSPSRQTFREQALLQLIKQLPDSVAITDEKGVVLFANHRLLTQYGATIGNPLFLSLFGARRAPVFHRFMRALQKEKRAVSAELLDCKHRYIRITGSVVKEQGSSAFVFSITDLSDHKALEHSLFEQRQLLQAERAALNKAAIVVETDTQGKITYANDLFVKVSGYKRSELLGKTHKVVNSGKHPPAFFKDLWRTLSRGKVWHGTIQNKAKDGKPYWLASSIAPVLDKNGTPIKYITVRFDVTEHVRGKKKILQKTANKKLMFEQHNDYK